MANVELEEISMTIIANSGEARGLAFQAIRAIREEKDYDKAKRLVDQANEYSLIAHHAQTDLLVTYAKGNKVEVDVLLVHSQDHLMTSMLAIELISEMIEFYKK